MIVSFTFFVFSGVLAMRAKITKYDAAVQTGRPRLCLTGTVA